MEPVEDQEIPVRGDSRAQDERPIKGTTGYRDNIAQFTLATESVDFRQVHEPYIDLIPGSPGDVLDLGAGLGRDASALAAMGHRVIAIEPSPEMRAAAQTLHDAANIEWLDDSLPVLQHLDAMEKRFDFVLASAVWHHLENTERQNAIVRIAELIQPDGIFALSLRHGPAGVGSYVFPTDHRETIAHAEASGFATVRLATHQPSLIPGKTDVSWTKLAFRKLEP